MRICWLVLHEHSVATILSLAVAGCLLCWPGAAVLAQTVSGCEHCKICLCNQCSAEAYTCSLLPAATLVLVLGIGECGFWNRQCE